MGVYALAKGHVPERGAILQIILEANTKGKRDSQEASFTGEVYASSDIGVAGHEIPEQSSSKSAPVCSSIYSLRHMSKGPSSLAGKISEVGGERSIAPLRATDLGAPSLGPLILLLRRVVQMSGYLSGTQSTPVTIS